MPEQSRIPPTTLLLERHAHDLGDHEHECGYLADRIATDEVWAALEIAPDDYQRLMDAGYRRSGRLLYRPHCDGCRACVPLRVPVPSFVPSRSQRRIARRNRDLLVEVGVPVITPEKFDLYRRYLLFQHPGTRQESSLETLRDFLYSSCVDTREILYRHPSGRLLGVSIVDVCSSSISSVYHFFEPDESRRSVGTFSVIAEIELCRRFGIPWYYLGYWVEGCAQMEYKTGFRPNERLHEGRWIRHHDA